jgi:hypothetical protein
MVLDSDGRVGPAGSLPAVPDLPDPWGRKRKEEFFQIVTENAADMIALV